MSRKKQKNNKGGKPGFTKSLASLSLEDIVGLQKTLPTILQSKLQQMSRSDDLGDLVKANLYMDNANQRQDSVKAVFLIQTKRAIRVGGTKTLIFTALCRLRCFAGWEIFLLSGLLSTLVWSKFRISFILVLTNRKKDTLSEGKEIL